jgi:glycosyltransferase involved in cell wall biosynthesis
MKIIVVTHWRIPSEKTMAPYMMRVVEPMAKAGHTVEFWVPRRVDKALRDVEPFAYHDIAPVFTIKRLPVLDLMPLNIGPIAFYIMLATFNMSTFVRALFVLRRDTVFYFFDMRDAAFILALPTRGFCEIHMYYRSSVEWLNWWGFRRLAGIVAATKPLREEILRRYHVPETKIIHEPAAVNFERFGIDTPQQEARTQLGLPQDRKIITYIGHLFPVKGVDVLFDAHRYLQNGEVIYFVGGTDEDIERFRQKWRDAGSPASIVVAGRKPHQEMPLWLRAADILSIPNTAKEAAGSYESSPSKLIEYMASGTPVVASDVPGIRDVVEEDMAYFVEPDNAHAIAGAVHEILANPSEAAARAASTREAAKNLSWDKRAERIIEFIKKH